MCHYITLIASTANVAELGAVMKRHGRVAQPIDNPVVRALLDEGERQYLTTRSCDCGTALVSGTPDRGAEGRRREAMKRKGWSATKINRALADQGRADDRSAMKGPDTIEGWAQILDEVHRDAQSRSVGLMVHFYAGDVSEEVFEPIRRRVASADLSSALAALREDEILTVSNV